MELDYDWTYQSDYQGTVVGAVQHETEETIDYGKLRAAAGEDILFYNENYLWEDEMGDNGTSVFSVKTRAMEYAIFILVRSFVRVDNVIFKSFETRYYIDLTTGSILQETRRKEQPFDEVVERVGREYRNNNLVADQLQVTETRTVKFI
jgi:type 2A phosphatase activator TIP41